MCWGVFMVVQGWGHDMVSRLALGTSRRFLFGGSMLHSNILAGRRGNFNSSPRGSGPSYGSGRGGVGWGGASTDNVIINLVPGVFDNVLVNQVRGLFDDALINEVLVVFVDRARVCPQKPQTILPRVLLQEGGGHSFAYGNNQNPR